MNFCEFLIICQMNTDIYSFNVQFLVKPWLNAISICHSIVRNTHIKYCFTTLLQVLH